MSRSVSVGATVVTVAVGIGAAVLTSAAGTAAASPDDGTTAVHSVSTGRAQSTDRVKRSGRADTPQPRVGKKPDRPRPGPGRPRTTPPALAPAPTAARTEAPPDASALPPTVSSAIAAAAPADPITGFVASLRALFDNQTPRLYPHQGMQSPSGVVTGQLNAVDPDSSALTFTVAEAPARGTASVGADGSWTYTPDPPLATTGGIDSFRVTVSDVASGFAIHGLAGLLHLISFGLLGSRGDTCTATVTVTVTPVAVDNNPPTGRASVTGVDPITGRVDGVVDGDDADGDSLTYAAVGTAKGLVSIDTTTGEFAYTPTPAARHAAARIGAPDSDTTDTFTATISDGRGGTGSVPASVPVTPANAGPVAGTTVVGTPDVSTAVVIGQVTATDADHDQLSYTAPPETEKGAVTVELDTGSFVYIPSAGARRNAAAPGATDADRSDSFTVTITDGHGGSATAAVVVTVSAAEQSPSAPGQLRPADLSFDGFFRVPTGQLGAGQYSSLAYGGAAMASRVVDGQRHFLLTGHRNANDPLVELVAPATLSATPGTAPVASVYRYWGDIYGGRKVTADEPDPAQANANWTEGLLWDEASQRVLWSYGNWYAALRENNSVLGATVLGDDGSITVQGPWRTTSESQQTRSFAVFLSPAVAAATGGATLGLGGKMQSINASASWGPSLHVIGTAAGDPGTAIVARSLISHPISPTFRRTPRTGDYQVARNPDGSLDSAGTGPPVDGVGFWTELDETTGAVFVRTGSDSRAALIYAGGQATGLIWYGPDLEHGVADGRGYNGKGNHAEHYRPVLWLVSEDDIVAAAEGRLSADQVNPYATVDLMAQFPELGFLDPGRPFSGTAGVRRG